MELFPDGHHVRLRSRGRDGMYLHADEDGLGVYLCPRRASLHAAWQVHLVERNGVTFVLLHGAAYGRYLAATLDPAPLGHLGQRVVQGVYDDKDDEEAVSWSPVVVMTGDDEVLLRHITANRLLRANGKYCRWRTGVSVDDHLKRDMMMHWVVEAIPPTPFTAELPPPSEAAPPASLWNQFFGRTAPVVERRIIWFVRAADDGSFDPDGWRPIEFHGRSVYNLRSAVAEDLNAGSVLEIKLCVSAGTLGRLTLLVIDLPRNEEPIDIVVLSTFPPSRKPGEVSTSDSMRTIALTPLLSKSDNALKPDDVSTSDSMPTIALTPLQSKSDNAINQSTSPNEGSTSGSMPITILTLASDSDAAPLTKELQEVIQDNDQEVPSIPSLGEHPSVGLNIAEEEVQLAELYYQNTQMEYDMMELKYQNLQQYMHTVHQDLTKEEKKRMQKEFKAYKSSLAKKKTQLSTLEQEVHRARTLYEREMLRS